MPSSVSCGANSLEPSSRHAVLSMTQSEERIYWEAPEVIAKLARAHGISEEAVKAVFDALRRGGGTMAQFSHADFGGMSQWSSGMTMVGDMFNDQP